jgi:hypothetical protein
MMIWIFVLVFLVRLAQTLRDGQGQAPAEGFVLLWSLLVLATGVFGVGALLGVLWCVPCFAVSLVLLMPWSISRHVLIPLGLARPAYWLARLAGWTWKHDRHGGGLVAGAWALLRQREPSRETMDWLARQRDRQPAFQASHVLATGLMAAARGDLASARVLLESVEEIGPHRTPRIAQALAREWLAADAASRGQWARVVSLARGARAATRTVRLLAKVGGHLDGNRAATASPVSLWWSWLVAPHRRHTLALVRQAARASVAAAGRGAAPVHALTTSLQPDPHTDALTTHVAVLCGQVGPSQAVALRYLAHAWDRALASPDTGRAILQRAATLGARNGARAVVALTETVARDLADMARAYDLPIAAWSRDSDSLREAERLLREQLCAEVELAFDALRDRLAQNRSLSSIDEWREWLSLRALHRRAGSLGGFDLRRLVFPHVHNVACKMAVWLWNERREYFLANAMFHWLMQEAVAVGDAEAIELQRRNWDDSF